MQAGSELSGGLDHVARGDNDSNTDGIVLLVNYTSNNFLTPKIINHKPVFKD